MAREPASMGQARGWGVEAPAPSAIPHGLSVPAAPAGCAVLPAGWAPGAAPGNSLEDFPSWPYTALLLPQERVPPDLAESIPAKTRVSQEGGI